MMMLLIAVAGGLGCVFRYLLVNAIEKHDLLQVPLATALVNVTGSFALGIIIAGVLTGIGLEEFAPVVGIGLLGGYTTFSAASAEAADLVLRGDLKNLLRSVLLSGGTLLASLMAGALGLILG